jgi:hypothetical protein
MEKEKRSKEKKEVIFLVAAVVIAVAIRWLLP